MLVSGRSGMVGLVLDAPPEPFAHGHFFEIVTGLSGAFSARDMDFVLHIGSGGDALTASERLCRRGTLDGFIVTAPQVRDRRIALLRARGAAFVVHGREPGADAYSFVDTDNRAISAAAVDLLAGQGHRRIALVNGPERWAYARDRRAGFQAAMAARGLPVDPALVRHGDTSGAYGAAAAEGLLAAAEPPTALVCCNSLAAAGVLDHLRRRGLRVPEDISLVAHDDDLPQVRTEALDPPLTVTDAPLRDCIEPLVDFIVRRIAGDPVGALQTIATARLIERRSVAPPRACHTLRPTR
jgi:LacI family transcriptional regulator